MSPILPKNQMTEEDIRENEIPFDQKAGKLNRTTISAIEDGRRIASDPTVKGYKDINELKEVLDI